MILKNQEHNIGWGSRQIYGILFDGAWLWEEYVNKLIGDDFYHPKNKEKNGAQYLFSDGIGLIFPDFISQCKEPRIIADAKYKPSYNISGKDYLQILAYMFRFDAKTGLYLYPQSESESNTTLLMNSGTTFDLVERRDDVRVIKVGFKIPEKSESYSMFCSTMKDHEEQFKLDMQCIMLNERI